MKKAFLTSVLATFCITLFGQPYANSWIDYTQTYFKIPVAETGVYRITKQELEAAGVPVSTFNPQDLQLFYRGNEQFVTINGQADGTWDDNDYLEFYGEKNDGSLDKIMYENPADQPHNYYSLYNDTSAYFLTWSTGNPGKRYTAFFENNYGSYSPESYYMYTSSAVSTDVYWDGSILFDYAQYSQYTDGEGWLSKIRDRGSNTKFNINTQGYESSGPTPTIKGRFYGKSNGIAIPEDTNHHLRVTVGTNTVIDVYQDGYYDYTLNTTVASADIDTNTTVVNFDIINDIGANADNNAISYFEITYPKNFNLFDKGYYEFDHTGPGAKSYLKFTNYDDGGAQPYLLDVTNGKKINGTQTGDTLEFIVENTGSLKHLVLINNNAIKSVNSIIPRDFVEVDLSANYDMLIITHNKLLVSATDYANYKKTRGFNPLVITIDQLYDQFIYGVNYHPLSIRNFCEYLLNESSTAPEYLLLIGKGQTNDLMRKSSINLSQNFMPTFGIPPTDYLLTAGLKGTLYEPALATGRIPAKNNEQVYVYLNKLMEFDSRVHDLSDKGIMHLGGGRTLQENALFRDFLKAYAEIAEDSFFGAEITAFYKDDALDITTALKSSIQKIIANGISNITYFGHGAAQILEVDIGPANEFKNKGRYPHFLFSGCILGNTFGAGSLCEDFLFEPNAGAISWMANSSYGFTNVLNTFTTIWYINIYVEHYGESLGKIVVETIKEFQQTGGELTKLQAPQITFHGDPSIILYSPPEPDYFITDNNAYISPPNVTVFNDSIDLALIIHNKGKAIKDSIDIQVKRTLPNNKVFTYPIKTVKYIPHTDTIFYRMPGEGAGARGNNVFEIIIDPENKIKELDLGGEANNRRVVSHYLPGNGVDIVVPLNNSIVNTTSVNLRAQSVDLFIKSSNYIFELDTSHNFNSPFKKQSGVVSSGILADWQVNLLPDDSVTYYWRVKLNVAANEGGIWRNGVFTYIKDGSNGWHQGHHGQFIDLIKNKIVYDTINRDWDFLRTTSDIHAIFTSGKNQGITTRVIRIDYLFARFGYITNGLAVMAINPCDMSRFNEPNPFNQKSINHVYAGFEEKEYYKKGTYSGMFYYNTTDATVRDSFVAFINRIPEGYHIMVHNGIVTGYDDWEPEMFEAFERFGAVDILTRLEEGHPYICYGQIGIPVGDATEMFADTTSPIPPEDQRLASSTVYYPCIDNGNFETDVIGPAKKWGLFYNKFIVDNSADNVDFEILGLDSNNNFVQIDYTEADTLNLSHIDAKKYPYIKVRAYIEDIANLTPAQIQNWGVTYDPVPEGTINPELGYSFYTPEIQEGDTMKMSAVYQNISELDMDSINVSVRIIDNQRNEKVLKLITYPPLLAGDWFTINYQVSTKGFSGNNKIEIVVNPGPAQPEQTLVNNLVFENFNVLADETNPMLDVVFDGVHLMNDEIISPNPNITITASDENPYLFIDDTSDIQISIKRPNSSTFEPVYFNRKDITFTAASSDDKKAKVLYSPRDLESGVYEMKVQANDASNNQAGNQEYNIRFQVIREATITHFYPYPNPFTTSMRFVFTVTGMEPPDYLKVTIMTVTGKVVREITTEEFGPIRIGNNISQFTWDGTDKYGDKLANGVYLYTVTARLNGEELKLRQTSADGSFINGVGKIYILR